MENDKAFSSIDIVGQCLIDEVRTLAFEEAIKKSVKTDYKVLDVGTGSGIMALFSARTGAKEIYALEYDPFIAQIAKNNFKNNNYSNIKELFIGDARSFLYPDNIKFDVVIMELLTTGMVDEYQIQALNNLHRQNRVSSQTIFIPKKQETYIALANSKFKIYGFVFKMIKHLWNNLSENQQGEILSENQILNDVDFAKINNEVFNKEIVLISNKDGLVNSVYLSSRTIFDDSIILKDTETLNAPVVVPIPDIYVKKGDKIRLQINYIFGGGYNNFKINIL